MHHHETGGNYHETLDLNSEMADCKRVTGDELTCLKLNVAVNNMPDYVHQLVTANLPPEEHDAAFATLESALAKSPNLFSSDNPDDNLKRAARVLGIPEIAARKARIAFKEGENAALDKTLLKDAETIAANEEGIAERNTMVVVLTDVTELEEMARNHENFKDLRGRDLLSALLADPSVAGNPELSTRLADIETKLNGMVALGQNPEEQAVLSGYINTASLNLAADTDYGVFRDLVAKVENDDTISDTTKAKVRAHFGVAEVETASDLQRLMVKGYGTDENGKVPITENNKAEVFPDTFVYEQPDGDHIFEVTTPNGGGLKIRFDETTTNQDLLERGFAAQVFGSLAQAGMADVIIGRSLNLQEGGVIAIDSTDIIKAQRIATMINGSDPTAEGRLLSSEDTLVIRQKLGAFSKPGSTDPITDLKTLSIISPDGSINWAQFERATIFINQSVASNGGVPTYDQLKDDLTGDSENMAA